MHIGGDYIYCTAEQLRNALSNPPQGLDAEEDIVVVDVDHKYPSHVWNLLSLHEKNSTDSTQPLIAILYGSLASRKTLELHQFLKYAKCR